MRLGNFIEEFLGECAKCYDEMRRCIEGCAKEESSTNTDEQDSKEGSLIKELQKAQAEKKQVDLEISKFENHSYANIPKFFELLKAIEDNGYRMGIIPHYHSARSRYIADDLIYKGTNGLERALSRFNTNDIDDIANELKKIMNNNEALANYRKRSKELEKAISEIKSELGIE